MSGLVAKLIGFLVSHGFRSLVERGLSSIEARAQAEGRAEAVRAQATVELARGVAREAEAMAQFNTTKLGYRAFWVAVYALIIPMIIWASAVVIDSIPYARDIFGDQDVADLPTPELKAAFTAMIQWLFYTGTTVGALKILTR